VFIIKLLYLKSLPQIIYPLQVIKLSRSSWQFIFAKKVFLFFSNSFFTIEHIIFQVRLSKWSRIVKFFLKEHLRKKRERDKNLLICYF